MKPYICEFSIFQKIFYEYLSTNSLVPFAFLKTELTQDGTKIIKAARAHWTTHTHRAGEPDKVKGQNILWSAKTMSACKD